MTLPAKKETMVYPRAPTVGEGRAEKLGGIFMRSRAVIDLDVSTNKIAEDDWLTDR